MAKIYDKLVELSTDNGIIKTDVLYVKNKVDKLTESRESVNTRVNELEKDFEKNVVAQQSSIKSAMYVGGFSLSLVVASLSWFAKDYLDSRSVRETQIQQIEDNAQKVQQCMDNIYAPKF